MSIIVQFSDEKETTIISWFASMPLIPDEMPNIGTVQASDPKWRIYYDAVNPHISGMPEPK